MEKDEEWNKQGDISIATIRSTVKRDSAMRILAFLNNNTDAYTITEISDEVGINWMTTKANLLKLMEAGFIEPEKDKMDKRTRHFKIADKKATEKAIELWEVRQRKLKKEESNPKPKVELTKPTEVEEIE
jgi:DNA-binding MarR family transcriptional regulator